MWASRSACFAAFVYIPHSSDKTDTEMSLAEYLEYVYIPHSSDKTIILFFNYNRIRSFTSLIVQIKLHLQEAHTKLLSCLHPS